MDRFEMTVAILLGVFVITAVVGLIVITLMIGDRREECAAAGGRAEFIDATNSPCLAPDAVIEMRW